MRATRLALALTLAAATLTAAAPRSHAQPSDLDVHVQRVMRQFDVPGLALAVVKDGEVVVAKGYGVRRLGEPARVDERTLFPIASNTKAFTATALGLLVEEGKLEWDAPVIRYLPWFQMYDPWVTREITVRDLLVHRSGLGLGAGDLLWWPPSTYTRDEIARRLRFIAPATSFRSAYAYDNVLYLVAGELIEAVSGLSWEEFVHTRIVRPVGMSRSTVRMSALEAAENVAAPHARVEGQVRIVEPFTSDNVNPAGGISASAEDIARWMIVQLDSGRVGARRLFAATTTRELWTPVTPMPLRDPPPELAPLRASFLFYGLGFNVRDYRGRKLVTHTGGLPGYVSRVAMVPDEKVGVAVLTNFEAGAAFNAIAYWVLDQYLDAPAHDWMAAYATVVARNDSATAAAERRSAAERDTSSRPSLPLARYAGTYTDAWYGDVLIAEEDDGLVIRFTHTPRLAGDLEHWQYDTFVARWHERELRADAFVTFQLGPDGSVQRVTMEPVSPATDFSFDFEDLLLRPMR